MTAKKTTGRKPAAAKAEPTRQEAPPTTRGAPDMYVMIHGKHSRTLTVLAKVIARALGQEQVLIGGLDGAYAPRLGIVTTTDGVDIGPGAQFEAEVVSGEDPRGPAAARAEPMTCADRVALQEQAMPVGSVVGLKSGGLLMTVAGHSPHWVEVVWAHGGEIKRDDFPFACLRLARTVDPDDDAIPF